MKAAKKQSKRRSAPQPKVTDRVRKAKDFKVGDRLVFMTPRGELEREIIKLVPGPECEHRHVTVFVMGIQGGLHYGIKAKRRAIRVA